MDGANDAAKHYKDTTENLLYISVYNHFKTLAGDIFASYFYKNVNLEQINVNAFKPNQLKNKIFKDFKPNIIVIF